MASKSPNKKKDKKSKKKSDNTAENDSKMKTCAGPAVAFVAPNGANEVEKWAMRALNKGIKGLQEEFLELKRYVPATWPWAPSPRIGTLAATATRTSLARTNSVWS
ncbi:hypothetical protein L596_013272 [Steinernema carpocapsae]|uniref:Uncharacterized protein n=1 Tax=Steinernema carpocapsae TaxID=34508 RepID=A0A4U5NZM8_STECR|nr:hypothetical protein L596_013272 [Steinernema carpocapsae]